MSLLVETLKLTDILKQLNTPENDGVRHSLSFLYEALTILDRKSDSLMAFDGILIAAAAFVVEKVGIAGMHWARRGAILIVIMLALIAAGTCLFVARIKYSFLNLVTLDAAGKIQMDREFDALSKVLSDRVSDYNIAWSFSAGAVLLSLLIAVSVFLFPPSPEQRPLERR